MAFRVEVDAKFIFSDDAVTLHVDGMPPLDLNKIDTLEEWRIALYGIASQSLSRIVNASSSKQKETKPVASTSDVMAHMGDQFRRQQEEISARTRKLQDDITKQYRDLTGVYEGAVKAAGRDPNAADKGT